MSLMPMRGARSGSGVTVEYIATASVSQVRSQSQTYSNVSIGAALPNRTVIVVAGAFKDDAEVITGVTIGGITATLDAVNTSADTFNGTMAIARAVVPTGTTANIVVSAAQDLFFGQIAVYTSPHLLSVVDSDFTNSDRDLTSVLTSPIATAAGGFILAGSQQRGGSSASTPSGWTSDVNNDWNTDEWFQSISRTTDGTSLTPNIAVPSNHAGAVAVSYEAA